MEQATGTSSPSPPARAGRSLDQRGEDKARRETVDRLQVDFREPADEANLLLHSELGGKAPQLLLVWSRCSHEHNERALIELTGSAYERAEILVRALLGNAEDDLSAVEAKATP